MLYVHLHSSFMFHQEKACTFLSCSLQGYALSLVCSIRNSVITAMNFRLHTATKETVIKPAIFGMDFQVFKVQLWF